MSDWGVVLCEQGGERSAFFHDARQPTLTVECQCTINDEDVC